MGKASYRRQGRGKLGKELGRSWLRSQVLVAVESIRITAHTSDAKVFASDVLMGGSNKTATITPLF
ncbi:MAG: hypothetical protein MIO92_08080 [Methanosarcinaceae archaeon]|nr:hypothetical protein [Methanosarcinaceae archaeon]